MQTPRLLTSLRVAAVFAAVLATSSIFIAIPSKCLAQEAVAARRVKTKVDPSYPDIARRMGISGTVRLAVVIAPNGTVKTTTAVGGHPVLLNAAIDAVKKWKFEPASAESTGTIEIKFAPTY